MNTNCVHENRIGTFKLGRDMFYSLPDSYLEDFFRNFVIVWAQCDFISNSVEYKAYSPLFKPVYEGFPIPYYFILPLVTTDEEGNVIDFEFSAER